MCCLRLLLAPLLVILSLCSCSEGGQAQPSSTPERLEGAPELADAGPSEEPDADGPIPIADAEGALDGGADLDGSNDADGIVYADVETGPDPMTLDGSVSTSIGGPSGGSLEGGVPFPIKAQGIMLNPRRLNPGGHYATVETIQALIRAAKVVDEAIPGGYPVTVNDLGFKKGGPIPHHGSHQAGRDVDVLFYLLDKAGNPRPCKGVPLDKRGYGWDFGDLADPSDDLFVKLDAKRTWRYLQALAEDDESLIQRIYVAEHLREILMNEAERAKAPREAKRLIGHLTCQPNTPHDDHFHFRFFCTAQDIGEGCEDQLPLYPWRRSQLKVAGVAPKLFRPRARRRSKRAKTVSQAEAAAKAGKMHWKVTAFLKRRETWSENPHPGRPYCR